MRGIALGAILLWAGANAAGAAEPPFASRIESEFFHFRATYSADERTDLSGVEVRWVGAGSRWSFRVGSPLMRVEGPEGIMLFGPTVGRIRFQPGGPGGGGGGGRFLAGGGGRATPALEAPGDPEASAAEGTESWSRAGIGDLRFQAARWITRERPAGRLALRGGVKLPTADESEGLGTGETDAWLGLGWRYEGWAADVNAWAEWVHLGDPPGVALRDGTAGQIAATWPIDRFTLRAGVNAATAPVAGEETRVSGFVGFDGSTRRRFSWSVEAAAGVTDSAPDFGFSLLVGY